MSTKSSIFCAGICVLLGTSVWAQATQRVSVATSGAQGNGISMNHTMSADGRYVAFDSGASNFAAGHPGVFVRDRANGTTDIVSVSSSGSHGNGISQLASISADGRYVAFESLASNFAPGDTNGLMDIYVRDRLSSTTQRVSVDSGGAGGNGASRFPTISADGRYVVFRSLATNFVPGDTNGFQDIFVRDRLGGTTEIVSVDSNEMPANGNSYGVSISADGRYVAFDSVAGNLVPGDTTSGYDVFLRDRMNGTTERVSVLTGGAQANGSSSGPLLSADGRYVSFSSHAEDLVAGDTNGVVDSFVHDRQTGTTVRESVDSNEMQGGGPSFLGAFSADGRYLGIASYSTFVSGDTNGTIDMFVRDRQDGTTERVNLGPGGVQANGETWGGAISADGRYVAFRSEASNLVPEDTNGFGDVFVRDRVGGTDFVSVCNPSVDGVMACPCSNPPSGVGSGCDNSSGTGGAILSASGGTFLSSDSLIFETSGEKPTALSILLQGNGFIASGVPFGQGVRCVGGTIIRRLFTLTASAGSIRVPDFAGGDPSVSARSAAKGDVIQGGQSRWYLVYYRDANVLGGCPATRTFNATQTGRVSWSP